MKKNLFFFFFLFTLLTINKLSIAQEKAFDNDPAKIYYNIGDGSTTNSILTTERPSEKLISAEEQDLLTRLDKARLDGDLVVASNLQRQLNTLNNVTEITVHNPDYLGAGMLETQQHYTGSEVPFYNPEYFRTTIQGGGFWSVATFTSHRTSAIFAAVTEYQLSAGDLLKVYISYDNGVHWTLKGTYNGFANTVDYRANELDMEVLINGADTLAFVVAGYNYNGHAFSQILKFNLGTGTVLSDYFSIGGATVDSVQTYNPRITSDHTVYSAGTYVMITAARDSSIGGGNEKMYYLYAQITSPFSNFDITYKLPNGNNGFWWYSSSQPSSAYLWQDIAYERVGTTNRVYTVFNHGVDTVIGKKLYLAYSNDYGSTVQGLTLVHTKLVESAKIAATGDTTNICIGYRHFYSPDWDFRGAYSTTGGDSINAFSYTHPEYTSDQSPKLIDLQAIKNSAGGYVFSWVNQADSSMRYRRTNTSGVSYNTSVLVDDLQKGDTRFGGIKAGYVNSNISDSSLVVWSGVNGASAYCSYNLYTPVGVDGDENSLPFEYSLQQNYPNPFNPNTTIKFSIPEQTNVKIKIFNSIGQEITTLLNTEIAAGNHAVEFNAALLSSGVYFYRIETPNFTSTKKMILMK